MKIDKAIRTAPWPEPFAGNERQHFQMTLTWPVVNHEKLLVATFVWNASRKPSPDTRDFRLICSKKLPAAAILYKGGSRGSRKELSAAMGIHTGWCYPEISEKDEKALAKWLGKQPGDTQNHFMPELDAWVHSAISAELLRERDARGELRDEDVDLCPEELPEGIVEYIRHTVLPEDRTLIYQKGNTRGICYCCGRVVRASRVRFRQNEMVKCPDCGQTVFCYLNTSDRFKTEYVGNLAAIQKGNGKWVQMEVGGTIIAEFTCDRIYELETRSPGGSYYVKGADQPTTNDVARQSCLTLRDMHEYLQAAKGYGWHISNLKIYDDPKQLSEFKGLRKTKFGYAPVEIKRPPQSWCYVEEL